MLYFAYGSNMEYHQMRKRCPSSEFFCIANLTGYRLDFPRRCRSWQCGVASIVREAAREVWGVVYRIEETDAGNLHASEGHDPTGPAEMNAYRLLECEVLQDGDPGKWLPVCTYVAVPQDGRPFLPSRHYMQEMIQGAKSWQLPQHYIKRLESIKAGP